MLAHTQFSPPYLCLYRFYKAEDSELEESSEESGLDSDAESLSKL